MKNLTIFRALVAFKRGNLFAYSPIFTFVMTLIMTTNPAFAEKLVMKREVLLTNEQEVVIEPSNISLTNDGGFIVVGNAGMLAMARKIDPLGKTLWMYTSELHDKATFPHPAAFRGIAEMTDSSIYLCGNVPSSPGKAPSGLLAHLDSSGRVLDERLIVPQNPIERSVTSVSNCIQWGDGLLIVGNIARLNGGSNPGMKTWHWLLMLDSTGKVKWEKQILSLGMNSLVDIRGTVLVAKEGNIFFSVTDNVNSELLNLSSTGEVQARKQLAGRFQFVHPVNSDGLLQIYGSFTSNTKPPRAAIFLNDKLEEIQKIQGDHPADFVAHLIYRKPDQSLVLFGSSVHTFGERLRSGIVHVDRLLQTEYSLDFDRDGLFDGGSIGAATPTKNSGEYALARSLVTLGKGDKYSGDIEPGFKRGAVLNFVQQQ